MTQATVARTKLAKSLNIYRRHFLNKNHSNLNEQSTRILINHLLVDVLGYHELEDIKIEHPVPGGYIDYLIKLSSENQIVVEAKALGSHFSNRHLRQAIYYSAVCGAKWIILTDGRFIRLYRVKFSRPLIVRQIFKIDLKDRSQKTTWLTEFLSRTSLVKGELNNFGKIYMDLDL
jgi:hypothetical protein